MAIEEEEDPKTSWPDLLIGGARFGRTRRYYFMGADFGEERDDDMIVPPIPPIQGTSAMSPHHLYAKLLMNAWPEPVPTAEQIPEEGAPISHIWRAFKLRRTRNDEYAHNEIYPMDWEVSGANSMVWKTSEMTAKCTIWGNIHHDAPIESCQCGIYGWYEISKVYSEYLQVWKEHTIVAIGRCEYWGKTIVGVKGVRTANAKLVKLYVVLPRWIGPAHPIVVALSAKYPDVEVVAISEAELLTMVQG